MLRRLHVRNFAIIDEVEVEFERGMTVLTGETGAGKSILVDALGLVLGERGGAGLTRTGSRRAEFSAEFDVSDQPGTRAWLAEQSLDLDDECLLRRVIGDDGRSRAFINGNAVPLTSLKALGETLLDIHGQHFHQSLGRPAVQRDLLDHFGGLMVQREAVAAAYAEWQSLANGLAELEAAEADRASRLDLLGFQAQELEALDLQPREYAELRAQRERFRHSAQLVESVTGALQAVSEGDDANARGLLAAAANALEAGAALDPRLEPVRRLIEEAAIQAAEAADALQRYGDSLDVDPERREWLEERLAAIQAIARKHRVDPEELAGLRERLLRQLDELTNAAATGARLRKEAA
ncbi:MAG TPA: AAA family ATPase, partial [Woeseiaceae bacterium]|nr:AAA family ATPase [Woeseiaceae bacterium]